VPPEDARHLSGHVGQRITRIHDRKPKKDHTEHRGADFVWVHALLPITVENLRRRRGLNRVTWRGRGTKGSYSFTR
jgi:hypothetical protein